MFLGFFSCRIVYFKKIEKKTKLVKKRIIAMSTCNVCCEDYNKTDRAKVTCTCEFEACRNCIKTYLVDVDQISDAHCMSCKVEWDRQFLSNSFEKTFMAKTWKNHRENILYERELSMMPETQIYVERIIELEKKENEKKSIENELSNLYMRLNECKSEINKLKTTSVDLSSRREFIRHCPNDDCRGFLNITLKCNICEMWACGDCREVKGNECNTEHVCKEDILASVKSLEKDTKPCPKCASSIFKIDGCNQIWCYNCHTAFDWKTLKIETGRIHSPEYFDYLRHSGKEIPRTEGDIPCGRELSHYFISRNISKLSKADTDMIRSVIYIRDNQLIRFNPGNLVDINRDIRIKYMMKMINKDKFKLLLQKREKETSKKIDISNLLEMWIQCMTDIYYRFEKDYMIQIQNLQNYTNECFKKIAETYNCKVYAIFHEK
jgi:hypothetical protein